ncbi:glycosyltransferase family 2 protein [endosymbiont of Riftia pachyptila]|uniref:Putative glycosyltransferase n=1 Tax=endosymbiont of Riftia pachyptila (vent Ph05) TaxID=1048808 RepID=G2DHX2_9GAMM|nr:glycosyltransferase family 2 protein [endosymbiont of Riftia pachyptila]EGV49786.1 putative glycosyltransferase [endosymbiont of Riftia pachyptila (vent Ph05)]
MRNNVAALVVNWNSWDQLACCLEALCDQAQAFKKIIVVDNASTMHDKAFVLGWEGRVEFVQLPTNQGFAGGNNAALQTLTDCDCVALINPDAYLEPNWLLQMLAAAERHPEAAALASSLVMADSPDTWDGLGDVYHISGRVWRDAHGKSRTSRPASEQEIFSPCAAAALYRTEALQRVGLFDEDFFCYVEDVDLGFRFRLAGYRCMLVPDAVAHHVGSATTGGERSDFAVYHGQRNLVWAFVKNMPDPLFWLLLPLHLSMNLAAILLFALRGQGRLVLRAKWDAIKGLPGIWRKRRLVQAGRVASVGEIWYALNKRLLPLR